MDNGQVKALVLDGFDALVAEDGDMGPMSDAIEAIQALLAGYADPDFACVMVPIPPTPEVEYSGDGSVARAWADWGGTFEDVRIRLDEVAQNDRAVAFLVQQTATTRHGAEVTQPSAMVWKFRDGRVERLEFHLDQDAARRSAGIE